MATDSSGRQAVDFVWGNFPMQPNDDRAATVTNTGGSTGDYGWAQTTKVASARLDAALDNHANVEAGWSGYPTFTASATVASANALQFTVTNAANGGLITGQRGKVESTTALTAADGVGLGNIIVPSVLGDTTAVAIDELRDAGYELANITTASAATNAAVTVTAAARTAGQTTTTITAASHGYVTGNKVTLSSVDASVNGTYTVTRLTDNTFTVTTTATTVLALTGITGSVVAVAGTIKSQSTAAGAAGVATTATITITPWAAASAGGFFF